jgi:ABC-2 type transport system ATP-binding protein
VIRVQDFHKAYDRTVAVAGISFEVLPGQILGLIGPNGAGKTTTLRALTGIIPASQGKLAVAGFDLQHDALQAKGQLAYIPDDPQLFHDLTVQQHLAFTSTGYQVQDAEAKVQQLVDDFQLAEKRNTPVSDLSRGMKQKLAVCCAYLHDPKALFFDEPLTGLDPRGIRALKESIRQRAADGAAVIISSHLLAMVEDICTDVLILDRGQQKFFGPILDVITEFAAGEGDTTLEEVFFHATATADA